MTPPLVTFEDNALIQMTLAGQSEYFGVLMDRHMGAVSRRVRSIVRNPTDAEDVLQETALKVWLRLSTFRSESSFRTWLTRVAVNQALESYRRKGPSRSCRAEVDLDTVPSARELQDESLIRAEVVRTVRNAIVGLSPKYRQVLTLCDLQDLSTRETAQRLNSTIPAVKTRLFRGRGMLLAAIQRSRNSDLAGAERRSSPAESNRQLTGGRLRTAPVHVRRKTGCRALQEQVGSVR
jgi:RNA polymerase sigma-70 factor (ECF subfamily)